MLTRTHVWLALPVLLAVALAAGTAPQPQPSRPGDWPAFGGDAGAQRYSTLTDINKKTVAGLQQAWAFDTGSRDLQATPLVVENMMYVTGGSNVLALEPETGKLIWKFDARAPVAKRGVAYWPGDAPKTRPRLFVGVGGGRMVALDRETGAVLTDFGDKGYVDLKQGIRGDVDGPFMLDSPPVVYRNVVITGGSNREGSPSTGLYGDIRG